MGKIVSAIIAMKDDAAQTNFFIGPPFYETAVMLGLHTNADIVYLKDGLIDGITLNGADKNYVIFENRCVPLNLCDVAVESEAYRNNTWRVFYLTKRSGGKSVFFPVFEKNFMQRIKDRIKLFH